MLHKYRSSELEMGLEYAALHDALTVFYGLYPEYFHGKMMSVRVNSD